MLPTFLEAEGPNYFTGDAQTCPETACNGQAASAGGAQPKKDAAAQVDTQRELTSTPS